MIVINPYQIGAGGSPSISFIFLRYYADQTNSSAALDVSTIGAQNGDIILVGFSQSEAANRNIAGTGDNSGAGTEIGDLYSTSGSLGTNLWVGVFKQGATPDTSITIDGIGSTSAPWAAFAVLYRTVNATPQDVAATTDTGTGTDLANPPSITPSTAGARIVSFYAATQENLATWTEPANMGNWSYAFGTTVGPVIGFAEHAWTSGAFNPDAVTGGNNGSNDTWAAVTLALRPA